MDLTALIGGMGFFVVGFLICIGSLGLGLGDLQNPDSGFVPFIAGSLMALLSLWDIARGFSSKSSGIQKFLSLWQGLHWGKAALLFSGTVSAIALLLPLSFGLNPVSAIIMLAGIYYG